MRLLTKLMTTIAGAFGFDRGTAPAQPRPERFIPPNIERELPKIPQSKGRRHLTKEPSPLPALRLHDVSRNCANRGCVAYFGSEQAKAAAFACERELQDRLRARRAKSADAGLEVAA
jgi:hypothetical protein